MATSLTRMAKGIRGHWVSGRLAHLHPRVPSSRRDRHAELKAKYEKLEAEHKEVTDKIVDLIQSEYPDAKLFVRSYDRTHALELRAKGEPELEPAVFELSELSVARANEYRVLVDKTDLADRMAAIAASTLAETSVDDPTDEFLFINFGGGIYQSEFSFPFIWHEENYVRANLELGAMGAMGDLILEGWCRGVVDDVTRAVARIEGIDEVVSIARPPAGGASSGGIRLFSEDGRLTVVLARLIPPLEDLAARRPLIADFRVAVKAALPAGVDAQAASRPRDPYRGGR